MLQITPAENSMLYSGPTNIINQINNEHHIPDEDLTTNEIDGYVVFLDVLGVKNKIKDGGINIILGQLLDLSKSVEEYISDSQQGDCFKFLSVSDCIILICERESGLNSFLKIISKIVWKALNSYELLLRGAITKGKLYVISKSDSAGYVQILGRAYMDAYELQENNAVYPRIIFSDGIKLNKDDKRCILDKDGMRFLNYIFCIANLDEIQINNVIEKLKVQYKKFQPGRSEKKIDLHIEERKKIAWAINYLKER